MEFSKILEWSVMPAFIRAPFLPYISIYYNKLSLIFSFLDPESYSVFHND